MKYFYEGYYEEENDEELTPEQIASHEAFVAETKRRSELGLISDVQEVALTALALMCKMEPKQMIIDRLGKEAAVDELKYEEAVSIITHYNKIRNKKYE
jgi:hypothetical protein